MKVFIKYACIYFVLATSSCSNNNEHVKCLHNDGLYYKIKSKLCTIKKSRESYSIIELASLTNFDWDSVYFFHGEESSDFISSLTKIKWKCSSVPNFHECLIFVSKNQVVSYVDFNTEPYEGLPELPLFVYNCLQSSDRVVPRENARFAAFRYCERGSVQYALVPLNCLNRFDSFKEMMIHGCPESDEKATL